LNSIIADWFNGIVPDVPWLPNDDIEILAAGIPPRKQTDYSFIWL
jgi:hypothetical protein